MVILLACVFCWVLLCNTNLVYFIYYIIYLIYVSFCAQKKTFPRFLIPCCVFIISYIIFVFKLNKCTDWRVVLGGMTKNLYHGIFLNYTGFTVYDGIYFFNA